MNYTKISLNTSTNDPYAGIIIGKKLYTCWINRNQNSYNYDRIIIPCHSQIQKNKYISASLSLFPENNPIAFNDSIQDAALIVVGNSLVKFVLLYQFSAIHLLTLNGDTIITIKNASNMAIIRDYGKNCDQLNTDIMVDSTNEHQLKVNTIAGSTTSDERDIYSIDKIIGRDMSLVALFEYKLSYNCLIIISDIITVIPIILPISKHCYNLNLKANLLQTTNIIPVLVAYNKFILVVYDKIQSKISFFNQNTFSPFFTIKNITALKIITIPCELHNKINNANTLINGAKELISYDNFCFGIFLQTNEYTYFNSIKFDNVDNEAIWNILESRYLLISYIIAYLAIIEKYNDSFIITYIERYIDKLFSGNDSTSKDELNMNTNNGEIKTTCNICSTRYCNLWCAAINYISSGIVCDEVLHNCWRNKPCNDFTYLNFTAYGILNSLKNLINNNYNNICLLNFDVAYINRLWTPTYISNLITNYENYINIDKKILYFLANRLDYLLSYKYWRLNPPIDAKKYKRTLNSSLTINEIIGCKHIIYSQNDANSLINLLGCCIIECYYKNVEECYSLLHKNELKWGTIGNGNSLLLWMDYYYGTNFNLNRLSTRKTNCCTSKYKKLYTDIEFNECINVFLSSDTIKTDIESINNTIVNAKALLTVILNNNNPIINLALGLWILLRKVYFLSGLIISSDISDCLLAVLTEIIGIMSTIKQISSNHYCKLMMFGSSNQTLYNCIDIIIDHSNDNSWYYKNIKENKSPAMNLIFHSLICSFINNEYDEDFIHDLYYFFLDVLYQNGNTIIFDTNKQINQYYKLYKLRSNTHLIFVKLLELQDLMSFECSDTYIFFLLSKIAQKYNCTIKNVKLGRNIMNKLLSERIFSEFCSLYNNIDIACSDNVDLETLNRIPAYTDEYLAEDVAWFKHIYKYTRSSFVRRSYIYCISMCILQDKSVINKLLGFYTDNYLPPDLVDSSTNTSISPAISPIITIGKLANKKLLLEEVFCLTIAIGRFTNLIEPQTNFVYYLKDLCELSYDLFFNRVMIIIMLHPSPSSYSSLAKWLSTVISSFPNCFISSVIESAKSPLNNYIVSTKHCNCNKVDHIQLFQLHIIFLSALILCASIWSCSSANIELIQFILIVIDYINNLPLPSSIFDLDTNDSTNIQLIQLLAAANNIDILNKDKENVNSSNNNINEFKINIIDAFVRNMCLSKLIYALGFVTIGSRDDFINNYYNVFINNCYKNLKNIQQSYNSMNHNELYDYNLLNSLLFCNSLLYKTIQIDGNSNNICAQALGNYKAENTDKTIDISSLSIILMNALCRKQELGNSSTILLNQLIENHNNYLDFFIASQIKNRIIIKYADLSDISIKNKINNNYLIPPQECKVAKEYTNKDNYYNAYLASEKILNNPDLYLITGNNIFEDFETLKKLDNYIILNKKKNIMNSTNV